LTEIEVLKEKVKDNEASLSLAFGLIKELKEAKEQEGIKADSANFFIKSNSDSIKSLDENIQKSFERVSTALNVSFNKHSGLVGRVCLLEGRVKTSEEKIEGLEERLRALEAKR